MLKLHDILRSGSVKRFHIVNTTRIQTLAEHQYNTAMIAGEIASFLGLDPDTTARVVMYAMVHDASEVRTGDVPSPTKKRMMERSKFDFNKAFSDFDVLSACNRPSNTVVDIVKAADFVESILFLGEHRVGRHSDVVYDDICANAEKFFASVDEIGHMARRVLSDVQNAIYEI